MNRPIRNKKNTSSDIVLSVFECLAIAGVIVYVFVSGVAWETWQIILLAAGGSLWIIFQIVSIVRSVRASRSFVINPNNDGGSDE